jgi:hypothetical protein
MLHIKFASVKIITNINNSLAMNRDCIADILVRFALDGEAGAEEEWEKFDPSLCIAILLRSSLTEPLCIA